MTEALYALSSRALQVCQVRLSLVGFPRKNNLSYEDRDWRLQIIS